MRFAFDNMAHYTDFSAGYKLYQNRARHCEPVTESIYRKVIKDYCKMIAEELKETGFVSLPSDLGVISTAILTRKPQYRGKKFVGYGRKNWNTGEYDGSLKTFGIVYLPRHGKNDNLRCYGFVANRRLFKDIKEKYESGTSFISPVDFKDEMI